jgi:hypothetical protein
MSTTTAPAVPPSTRRRGGWCVVAAEPRSTYRTDAAPEATSTPGVTSTVAAGPEVGEPAAAARTGAETASSSGPAGAGAPFGLPVLAALPTLAGMLESLEVADRAMSDALRLLATLVEDDQVVTATGVGIEEWIGIVARHTRLDRRLLLRTARLLHRFPTLHTAVAGQQLSWPQLRGLTLVLRDTPKALDEKVDTFLAKLVPHLEGTDPDAVIRQVERALAEWRADLEPEPEELPARNFLHLQPRLDGTGGRFTGEFDAVGIAIVDDATAPTRAQLDHPGGPGGARADNLLTRLTHTCTLRPSAASDGTDDASTDDTGAAQPRVSDDGGGPAGGALPDVKLLLRCDYDDLLDATRTPAALLTRLVGGSLRLTSAAARRLLDDRGAELRAVVVDHGQVLGVGRATRVPPGWLRDATLAVHDACTGPLCDRPALGADLDHARPWHPTHPGQPPGGTDIDNLGPLCAATNRAKETAGWRATQRPDGRRTWGHPRTGLTITSLPATWRPPPTGPP